MDLADRIALVNKPPIEEIVHFDLVNKPPIDELYHYGILGMKWGIRRYQNPDGSLTPEGLKRQQKKEKRRRESILSDPKKLAKHISEFSREEVERAMQNFEWQDQLKKTMAFRKSQAKREVEGFVDGMVKAGDKINDAITFLNTGAGKELRKALGMDTRTLGEFKSASEIERERQARADKEHERERTRIKEEREDRDYQRRIEDEDRRIERRRIENERADEESRRKLELELERYYRDREEQAYKDSNRERVNQANSLSRYMDLQKKYADIIRGPKGGAKVDPDKIPGLSDIEELLKKYRDLI